MRYTSGRLACAVLALCVNWSCNKDKAADSLGAGRDPLGSLGAMKFSGKVNKAGSGDPIEGASVRLIKLLDLEAIKKLVEVAKIPDGAGGTKDRLRIKIDKVHGYPADVEAKTDASGAFATEAPIQ